VQLGEDCLSTWSQSESCEFRSPAIYWLSRARSLPDIRQAGAANRGRLFLGYFLLATQKKVTSRRAAPGKSNVNETSYDKPRNTLINEAISH